MITADVITGILALIGAVIGGVLVVYLETRARRREQQKRFGEERKGLLTLVTNEINLNNINLRQFQALLQGVLRNPEWNEQDRAAFLERSVFYGFILKEAAPSAIKTESWDSAKVRLAQLLDSDTFLRLSAYYDNAGMFRYALYQINLDNLENRTYLNDIVAQINVVITHADQVLERVENGTDKSHARSLEREN